MASPIFDRLAYYDRLKAAGLSTEVARAHADGLDRALRESLTGTSELEKTEPALRSDPAKFKSALHADLESFVMRLEAKIDIRAGLGNSDSSLSGFSA